jgi:hypothetical protein
VFFRARLLVVALKVVTALGECVAQDTINTDIAPKKKIQNSLAVLGVVGIGCSFVIYRVDGKLASINLTADGKLSVVPFNSFELSLCLPYPCHTGFLCFVSKISIAKVPSTY